MQDLDTRKCNDFGEFACRDETCMPGTNADQEQEASGERVRLERAGSFMDAKRRLTLCGGDDADPNRRLR